jgi:hypothetical protein
MKKLTFYFLILFYVIGLRGYSDPIDIELAALVAKNIYYERINLNMQVLSYDDIQPVLLKVQSHDNSNDYFIFGIKDKRGFVIVAADNEVIPILGYSIDNSFDTVQIPEVINDWLFSYSNQINYVRNNHLKADQNIKKQWKKYSYGAIIPTRDILSSGTLLKSVWGQGSDYNSQIPFHYPVGCVALSMGEVMRYFKSPTKGTGFHSYQSNIGYLDANFGNTTYQWQNMPDTLTGKSTPTQINAVGILLRHCGISVETYYTGSGSGSNLYEIPDALTTYFNYSTANYIVKSQYNDYVWEGILVSQINSRRPVIYGGMVPDNSVGHAFVCDGYQGSESNYQFHFDWGWNGSYNGYFSLSSLNPGTSNFNKTQQAVININPYKLALNGDLVISSNPVRRYSSFSVKTKITNFNTLDYKGSFDVVLIDTSGSVALIIDSITGKTLAQDYVYSFTFNSKKITIPIGNYSLAIRYKNSSGNMTLLPQYLYNNPVPFQIINGYPGNNLTLDSQLIITPNPVVAFDSFTVSVNLINFDTLKDFRGDICAGFYNPGNGIVDLIDTPRTCLLLAPLEHYSSTIFFHCNSFFQYDGIYKFGIFQRESEVYEWSVICPGLYLNPIDLRVINTSGVLNKEKEDEFFFIYPNPSKGIFTIKLLRQNGKPVRVCVFDINGKIVQTTDISPFQSSSHFDLTSKKKGIYILEIINGDYQTRKMITLL